MKRGITITPRLDLDGRQLWAEPEYMQVFLYLAHRLQVGGSLHVLELVEAIDELIDTKPENFSKALSLQRKVLDRIQRSRLELDDAEDSMKTVIKIAEGLQR